MKLLITVLSRSIKRKSAFSQVVTMIRLTLMYSINFISFMENPDKTWDDIIAINLNILFNIFISHPPNNLIQKYLQEQQRIVPL